MRSGALEGRDASRPPNRSGPRPTGVPMGARRANNQRVLWGERFTRRRVLVGILVVFALADAALAFAVMQADGSTPARAALPFHPVANDFRPDDTQLGQCSDQGCFQQAFGNIAYRQGPKPALALVDEIYGNGSDPACHRVTHLIGAASLARFRGNVTKTLGAGAPTCWSGYYHGVLERSLVKAKSRQPDVARGGVAEPLLGHETHALGRLRLPPRPGARVDDRNRLEPPDLAGGVLEARPLVGPRCVSRRRIHGEHLVVVRLHIDLLARRRPGVSVQLGAAGREAALLPGRHVADPVPGRRRLGADCGELRAGGERLRRLVLPLVRS